MGLIRGYSNTDVLKFLLEQMHYTNNGSGASGTYGYTLEFIVSADSAEDAIRKLIEAKGNTWDANELPDYKPDRKPPKKKKKAS